MLGSSGRDHRCDATGRRRVVRRHVHNLDSTTEGVGEFVERTYAYDILDNLLEETVEVDADTTLVTQYRYDENELLVETTHFREDAYQNSFNCCPGANDGMTSRIGCCASLSGVGTHSTVHGALHSS